MTCRRPTCFVPQVPFHEKTLLLQLRNRSLSVPLVQCAVWTVEPPALLCRDSRPARRATLQICAHGADTVPAHAVLW